MVGIGVIGFGYWGPNLVRNVASLSEAQLRVVCDRSADRLQEVGRLYPGVDLVDSAVEVLNRSDIDAVILATPADTHFDLARRVLESGRSVFVEKPLARSASECEQLIELAAKKDLVLMVGHTFEYNAAVEYVDDLISRRDLGQIYYIYSQRLNLGVVRQDVNALWNLAPHDISIALRWLKKEPARVCARGYTYLQAGVEDVVYLDLEFDSTEAKIQVFDKGIDREPITPDGPAYASLGEFDSFGKFQLTQRAGDLLIPKIDFTEPLKRECSHFVDCVRENRRPLTDGESGLRVVRILEAGTKSLRQGGIAVDIVTR